MASFAFELVSPERLLISEQVDSVTAPGVEGAFTVLANHAPFITVLRPGLVTIRAGANTQSFYVRGGFAEVNPEGLTILADFALPASDLDDAALAREVEATEAALAHAAGDEARAKAAQTVAWIKDIRAGAGAAAH